LYEKEKRKRKEKHRGTIS